MIRLIDFLCMVFEEAAITECPAEHEGRSVVSKIFEEAKTQKIFDDATKEMKTTSILEATKPDCKPI